MLHITLLFITILLQTHGPCSDVSSEFQPSLLYFGVMASTSTKPTDKVMNTISSITSKFRSAVTGKHSDDSASIILQDINALRTMITMLSLIQRVKQPGAASISRTPTADQSEELKVLSALATVLVMEHEIVAVVAKQTGGGCVEVVASTDMDTANNPFKPPITNPLQHLWNLVATTNPRKGTDNSLEIINSKYYYDDHPTDTSLVTLKKYVRNHW
jgi:hypothetical protein